MDYWIWLSQLPGVGPVLQKKLLEVFETPENIYRASIADLLAVDGVGNFTAQKIVEFRIDHVGTIIRQLEKQRINVITAEDPRYKDVFSCKRSPLLFYYKGRLPEKRGIAIVGARRCTLDAKRASEEISTTLSQYRLPIISGMAKGVDSYAHTACLKAGGYTIAVLANGVDICYPKEHRQLYERIIANGGAILSAYPPSVKAHPKFFLERNAHISAWATDVVVVQASEKSGSLTTARFALEQGRNLYAVPHSIYVNEAKGSNQLLEQGALPYLGFHSLKYANLEMKPKTPTTSYLLHLTDIDKKIMRILQKKDGCTVNELCHHLQISQLELMSIIMDMEMNNLVKVRGTTIFYGT